jgi:hypothetical protein
VTKSRAPESAGESSLLFAASSWTVDSGVVPERWRRQVRLRLSVGRPSLLELRLEQVEAVGDDVVRSVEESAVVALDHPHVRPHYAGELKHGHASRERVRGERVDGPQRFAAVSPSGACSCVRPSGHVWHRRVIGGDLGLRASPGRAPGGPGSLGATAGSLTPRRVAAGERRDDGAGLDDGQRRLAPRRNALSRGSSLSPSVLAGSVRVTVALGDHPFEPTVTDSAKERVAVGERRDEPNLRPLKLERVEQLAPLGIRLHSRR